MRSHRYLMLARGFLCTSPAAIVAGMISAHARNPGVKPERMTRSKLMLTGSVLHFACVVAAVSSSFSTPASGRQKVAGCEALTGAELG